MKNFSLRHLIEVGIVAGLYAALVHFFAPISFTVIQFRIPEFMKPFVIYRKHLIWAMAIGVGVANLLSPFGGPWELIWMPVMNLAGGYLTWLLGQRLNPYIAAGFYAIWLSVAVAVMLMMVAGLPFFAALSTILPAQLVLVVGGVPIVQTINRRLIKIAR